MLLVSRQGRAGVNREDERRKVTEKKRSCEIKKDSEQEMKMVVVITNHLDIH